MNQIGFEEFNPPLFRSDHIIITWCYPWSGGSDPQSVIWSSNRPDGEFSTGPDPDRDRIREKTTGPDTGISDRDYGDLPWIYPFYITVHTIRSHNSFLNIRVFSSSQLFTQNKVINETNLIQSGLNTFEKSRSNPGQKSLSGHRTGIVKNRCPVTGIPVGYCKPTFDMYHDRGRSCLIRRC